MKTDSKHFSLKPQKSSSSKLRKETQFHCPLWKRRSEIDFLHFLGRMLLNLTPKDLVSGSKVLSVHYQLSSSLMECSPSAHMLLSRFTPGPIFSVPISSSM